MRTFTLDTNCLIDIEKGRPPADALRKLAAAHAAGLADIAVVAMSASERPQGGHRIHNFAQFEAQLAVLGLAHLTLVLPMAYFDISFWDRCVLTDAASTHFERQIHSILFPNEQFHWTDYCHSKGIDPLSDSFGEMWRNHKCDVQIIWSHMNGKRDVFVTTDGNFHRRKAALIGLGAGRIEYPDDALQLL